MQTLKQFALTFAVLGPTLAQEAPLTFGPSAFTAPGTFPTSVYSKYFNSPTATSAQVQPVISDPVLVRCQVVLFAPEVHECNI
jgi:sphingomyelin phosphodiesterase